MALVNGANTFVPMAMLYSRPDQELGQQLALDSQPQPAALRISAGQDRKPYSCTNLQNLAYAAMSAADTALFGKAEAAKIWVSAGRTSTVSSFSTGDQMYIYGRGNGNIGTMNDGYQFIGFRSFNAANGSVTTMISGGQDVIIGTGTIATMNGGLQNVEGLSTNKGIIGTMTGGTQTIKKGAHGSISIMYGGTQSMTSATGTITTMSGGTQLINDKVTVGTIGTLAGGTQVVNSGTGNVTTMNTGLQVIDGSGTGSIGIMHDGIQGISKGTGSVTTMSGGTQVISGEEGPGTIATMRGGTQIIRDFGTGTVTSLSGGTQQVGYYDPETQSYDSGGTAIATTMYNGGLQTILCEGSGIVNLMNGGIQNINSDGIGTVSALNGGTQEINKGGTALNTNINGGTQIINKDGTALNTNINGGTQNIESGGTSLATTLKTGGAMNLSSGAQAQLNALSGGSLKLAEASTITLGDGSTTATGTYNLDKVDTSGGTIVLGTGTGNTASAVGSVLNIANLNGSANFVVNTDLANSNSDKINIANASNSTNNTLTVNYDPYYDSSAKNVSLKGVTKIITAPMTVQFTATPTDWGALKLAPVLKQNSDGSWDLEAAPEVVPKGASENTMTAADSDLVINEAWFDTVNSLSKRLGDLRRETTLTWQAAGTISPAKDGIWARYQRATTRAGRGRKAELNDNLLQIGYDKALARKDGTAYIGIAVDHLNGSSAYTSGSGKVGGTSVALYDTWLGNKGHYYDLILRQGHFSDDYLLTDLAGTAGSADYGVNATTLSGEYGWRKNYAGGRYLEPQAEIIYGHLSGADYTTSTGWPVHVDAVNHFITRLGVVLGHNTNRGSYYFKTSYFHDFGGAAGSVRFADYNYERTALRDWAELTLGGDIRLAKNTQIYGELTKYLGDLTNNLNINVGLRFSF